MNNKRLFYFTNSYPYGRSLQWKVNELAYLRKHFAEITLVPFCYAENREPEELPEHVSTEEPLFQEGTAVRRFKWKYLVNVLNIRCWFYFREFIGQRVYQSKYSIISWLNAVAITEGILNSDVYKQLVRSKDKEQVTLYFFWGLGSSFVIPFLAKYNFSKIVVRFHGYDLYEERNHGYMPFRTPLLNSLTAAVPVSQVGVDYLTRTYPGASFSSRVMRLGVKSKGKAGKSTDGVLRIVSCSRLIPLKRVDLIVKSLMQINFPVEWKHIGDGETMNAIKGLLDALPPNIVVTMEGWMQSDKIAAYYAQNVVDLFINVSSTEGVPVSAMEAMAAGIPVYATDVGGTGEIIDEKVGKLLSEDIGELALAEQIKEFYSMEEQTKVMLGTSAYERYEQKCDGELLAKELAEFLDA